MSKNNQIFDYNTPPPKKEFSFEELDFGARRKIIEKYLSQKIEEKEKRLALTNEIKIQPTIKKSKNTVRSLTLETIFHCDERDREYYNNDNDNEIISSTQLGYSSLIEYEKHKQEDLDGFPTINFLVKTLTFIKNINTKHYLQPGEECPICYEQIWTKREAFLTSCGHSFHYRCIIKNNDMCYGKNNFRCCPMCRNDISGETEYIKERYHTFNSHIDRLENFNDMMETIIPRKCYVSGEYHNKGMEKWCERCLSYRKHGV